MHAWTNLGNALYDTQRFAEAVAAFRTAIDLAPRDATAYANLAVTLASGTQGATSADIVISSIPALTNGQLITIRVRNYGTTKYQPYETQAALIRSGTLAYIVQTLDTIGA